MARNNPTDGRSDDETPETILGDNNRNGDDGLSQLLNSVEASGLDVDEETVSVATDLFSSSTDADEDNILQQEPEESLTLASFVQEEPRTVGEVHETLGESLGMSRAQSQYRLEKLTEEGVIKKKKGPGKTDPKIFWRD